MFYTETDPRQPLFTQPSLLDVPLSSLKTSLLRLQLFQALLAVFQLFRGRAHASRPLRRRLLGLDERLVLIDEFLPAQSLLRLLEQPDVVKRTELADLFLGQERAQISDLNFQVLLHEFLHLRLRG